MGAGREIVVRATRNRLSLPLLDSTLTGEGRAAKVVLKVGATSKPVLVAGAIAGVRAG